MRYYLIVKQKKAQTVIEYMLLLTTVVALVLIGLRAYFPTIREAANIYYNRVVPGILGDPPACGDGSCGSMESCSSCPVDCGTC